MISMLYANGFYQVNWIHCCNNNIHVSTIFIYLGWLLALEFFITIGLFCTLGAQLVLAGIVTRYPLEFVLKNEYLLITGSFIASAITCAFHRSLYHLNNSIRFRFNLSSYCLGFCIFMMIIIFPWNCWRRDWLLNPMFNHLSWAYYSLFFSLFFHAIGTNYLYKVSFWNFISTRRLNMYVRNNIHSMTYSRKHNLVGIRGKKIEAW